jgi:hypothetical protein
MCWRDAAAKPRCGSKVIAGISRRTAVAAALSSRTASRASSCCSRLRAARSRCVSSGSRPAIASRSTCRIFPSRCTGPKPASASASSTRPCSAASATRLCRTASTTPARASSSPPMVAIAMRRSSPSRRRIRIPHSTATCPPRSPSLPSSRRSARSRCRTPSPPPFFRARAPRSPPRSRSSAPMSCAAWVAHSKAFPGCRPPKQAASARRLPRRWSRRRRASTRSSSCATQRSRICCGAPSATAGAMSSPTPPWARSSPMRVVPVSAWSPSSSCCSCPTASSSRRSGRRSRPNRSMPSSRCSSSIPRAPRASRRASCTCMAATSAASHIRCASRSMHAPAMSCTWSRIRAGSPARAT